MVASRVVAEPSRPLRPVHHALAGLLFLMLALLAIARPANTFIPLWMPGLLGWVALGLLWGTLKAPQKGQSLILLVGGLAAALVAWKQGVVPAPAAFLRTNVDLVALLAGVGFLRLVALPRETRKRSMEKGSGAFARTLFGSHLLSSVINLSALFIVADRLLPANGDRARVLAPLTRAFSAAAFWSPFFAAMGVALTYAPGARIHTLVVQGLPLALLALLITFWEARRASPHRLEDFVGYPLHFEALWLPASMVLGVLLLHWWLPGVSIILLVAALSILLTVVVLVVRAPQRAFEALAGHVTAGLPRQAGEFTLFLAAGVFATGMGYLFKAYASSLVLGDFSLMTAWVLLVVMVLLALIGVHPVISITMAGVWLAPLSVDGNFLGTLFLCVWAIGVVAAPFSGMNLALAGRYGIRGRAILRWHRHYLPVMLLAAMAALAFYFPDS